MENKGAAKSCSVVNRWNKGRKNTIEEIREKEWEKALGQGSQHARQRKKGKKGRDTGGEKNGKGDSSSQRRKSLPLQLPRGHREKRTGTNLNKQSTHC